MSVELNPGAPHEGEKPSSLSRHHCLPKSALEEAETLNPHHQVGGAGSAHFLHVGITMDFCDCCLKP